MRAKVDETNLAVKTSCSKKTRLRGGLDRKGSKRKNCSSVLVNYTRMTLMYCSKFSDNDVRIGVQLISGSCNGLEDYGHYHCSGRIYYNELLYTVQ